jgi:feruloyl esterase
VRPISLLALTCTLAAGPLFAATPCEDLSSFGLPHVAVTSSRVVPSGPFTPPGRGGRGPTVALPAHCRVVAIAAPSPDSRIAFEVWLPASNWNGKLQVVGNGGWAGSISYPALATALQDGYATASTDTGHEGGNALFAVGHPEKLIDFAYRAVHETTAQAKALIAAFYDRGPRLSYWTGCSTGGRQGLMAAQRYPADFDAILAGAPANAQTAMHAYDLSIAVPTLLDPAGALPAPTLARLNQAVLTACDARDGVTDGLITNPRACTFDPATLTCRGGSGDDCLTAAQIATVTRVYAPAGTRTGAMVFPGKELGSELGWSVVSGGAAPPGVSLGSFIAAYDDPNWDWRGFDLDRDLGVLNDRIGFINATDPDLTAFKNRGGKLLLYHGWNDTAISPGNSVRYYASVLETMGPDQGDWIRLFMAPGMAHCGGGPGPNRVDFLGALERWRESGVAPAQLTASRLTGNRADMTRPLCPFPQVAEYLGAGNPNDAANFVCKAP